MKPDEETLALWLEDELDEIQAAKVDAWAQTAPAWLEHRAATRMVKPLLATHFTAADIPSGEFFNARILREIRVPENPTISPKTPETPNQNPAGRRHGWTHGTGKLLSLAAAAGIVFGFLIGHSPVSSTRPAVSAAPVIYTPEQGVAAKLVTTDLGSVILLDGVSAFPDDWKIPQTAATEAPFRPVANR